MTEKTYLSAQGLLEEAFRLGARVLQSGFKPTFIVAIWRGGAPIGIAVQEFLQYHGIQSDHIAIRTSTAVCRRSAAAAFGGSWSSALS